MKSKIFSVLGSILLFAFFGFFLFIGVVFALLVGLPLYLTYSLAALGGILIVIGCLCVTGALRGRGCRWGWRCVLTVAVVAVIYCSYNVYLDSLPTVDDRTLLVQEYQPFRQMDGKQTESKLVQLEEPAEFRLDNAWKLRLDGATALYPIYAAFVEATYPEGDYPYYMGSVQCNGTVDAYRKLIQGEVDMIFAAGPSEDQLKAAKNAGKELHLTPIGREAFVFFVNSKNPVENLTVEQIQGIYTGEITNWKHLGGKLQRIRPFQREENSGSQTALQNLMAGLPLIEPEKRDRIAGMGGIITEVASYRNHKNAIGFTFRYYATEMVGSGDIRLLSLNGIEPTKETIRDGSYPIASEFYAVTAAPMGKPAPQENNQVMAEFLDWILSDQGQWIVEETGYVSLK